MFEIESTAIQLLNASETFITLYLYFPSFGFGIHLSHHEPN